jgi:hypothetical protein
VTEKKTPNGTGYRAELDARSRIKAEEGWFIPANSLSWYSLVLVSSLASFRLWGLYSVSRETERKALELDIHQRVQVLQQMAVAEGDTSGTLGAVSMDVF